MGDISELIVEIEIRYLVDPSATNKVTVMDLEITASIRYFLYREAHRFKYYFRK